MGHKQIYPLQNVMSALKADLLLVSGRLHGGESDHDRLLPSDASALCSSACVNGLRSGVPDKF
jgi:hypothetical protein